MINASGIINIDALGLSVTIIDIVLVLFVLVMAIIGRFRGFVKIFFSLFGTLAVVIGSVLLASTVAEFLVGPLGHFIENPVADWMMELQAEQGTTIFTDVLNWSDEPIRNGYLPIALETMGLPEILAGIISSTGVFNSLLQNAGEVSLIEVLPHGVATIAMTVVSFILLLIVFGILLIFVRKLFTNITKYRLLGGINKFLGFLLGAVQAYVIISVVLTILTLFPLQGLIGIVYEQLDASIIAKFLAENNIIGNWLISTIFG